jgi:hypothetical protein
MAFTPSCLGGAYQFGGATAYNSLWVANVPAADTVTASGYLLPPIANTQVFNVGDLVMVVTWTDPVARTGTPACALYVVTAVNATTGAATIVKNT